MEKYKCVEIAIEIIFKGVPFLIFVLFTISYNLKQCKKASKRKEGYRGGRGRK